MAPFRLSLPTYWLRCPRGVQPRRTGGPRLGRDTTAPNRIADLRTLAMTLTLAVKLSAEGAVVHDGSDGASERY